MSMYGNPTDLREWSQYVHSNAIVKALEENGYKADRFRVDLRAAADRIEELERERGEAIHECNCPGAFAEGLSLPTVIHNLIHDKHEAERRATLAEAEADAARALLTSVGNSRLGSDATPNEMRKYDQARAARDAGTDAAKGQA